MKLVEAQFENEVLDQSSVEAAAQKRASDRMKRIVMTPEEQTLCSYAPNRARNLVDRPGYPDEDYGETD